MKSTFFIINVTVPEPESVCVYLSRSISKSDVDPPDNFCHLILVTVAGDTIVAVKVTSSPYFTLIDGVVKVTEIEPVEIDQVSTHIQSLTVEYQINKCFCTLYG